ncbi:MAG: FecR domain-containing protein, partial [Odoribacter sp.]|nr:FecR domain-containing protein [Odoribacter sp.]
MVGQGQDVINITLIYRKLNGELTASEEDRLQKWLEASAEHRRYFERMRRYVEQLPECAVSEDEIDKAWKALAGKVASRQRRSWRILGVYGTSVAAMIVLCLGGWMLWKGMSEPEKGKVGEIVRNEIVPGQHMAILELANGESHRLGITGLQEKQIGTHIMVDSCRLSYVRPDSSDSQSLQIAYNKLSVPRGGEYQLKLEDGTRVWLNSDSRLKYPEVFVGNLREVFWEGEAYFEVAADSLRPFVVNAGEQ